MALKDDKNTTETDSKIQNKITILNKSPFEKFILNISDEIIIITQKLEKIEIELNDFNPKKFNLENGVENIDEDEYTEIRLNREKNEKILHLINVIKSLRFQLESLFRFRIFLNMLNFKTESEEYFRKIDHYCNYTTIINHDNNNLLIRNELQFNNNNKNKNDDNSNINNNKNNDNKNNQNHIKNNNKNMSFDLDDDIDNNIENNKKPSNTIIHDLQENSRLSIIQYVGVWLQQKGIQRSIPICYKYPKNTPFYEYLHLKHKNNSKDSIDNYDKNNNKILKKASSEKNVQKNKNIQKKRNSNISDPCDNDSDKSDYNYNENNYEKYDSNSNNNYDKNDKNDDHENNNESSNNDNSNIKNNDDNHNYDDDSDNDNGMEINNKTLHSIPKINFGKIQDTEKNEKNGKVKQKNTERDASRSTNRTYSNRNSARSKSSNKNKNKNKFKDSLNTCYHINNDINNDNLNNKLKKKKEEGSYMNRDMYGHTHASRLAGNAS